MENFKIEKDIVFDNCYSSEEWYHSHVDGLIDISEKIKTLFKKSNQNSAELCFLLNSLKEEWGHRLNKVNGKFVEFYEYCESAFGLAKKTVMNYIIIYNKFCIVPAGGNNTFKSPFDEFNISKLADLCSVSDTQLSKDLKNNKLTSSMTRKQIRDYVKALKGGEKEENKVLEEQTKDFEEREPFDVKKTYSVEYYEKYSKTELITIIGLFEKEVQRLMKKK